MDSMNELARALCDTSKPVRLCYAVATGANTVQCDGSTTELTLPAINSVTTGDYCAVLMVGADRLILGPVT